MKKFGCDNKPRFTIRFPDGITESYGSCDPRDDDHAEVIEEEGRFYLAKYKKDGRTLKEFLFSKTVVTNGYYDYEHDGWVSPEEFVKNGSN